MVNLKVAVIRNSDHPINVIFVRSLRKNGINAVLFVPKGKKKLDYPWIKEFNYFGDSYYPIPLKMKEFLKEYTVINASSVFYPHTLRSYIYSRNSGKKLILTCEKYFYSRKKINYFILKLLYSTIGRIILNDEKRVVICAHSIAAKEFHQVHTKQSVFYLPPAIEINPLNNNRFKINDSKIRMITVSRHIYARDLRNLIIAFHLLNQSYKNGISLTIIGDGELFDKNKALANKLNSNIEFIKHLEHKKLLKIYSKYDIYIQPAIIEATGIAVLEAMSSGLPVVATFIGGLKDLMIQNKKNPQMNEKNSMMDHFEKYGVAFVCKSNANEYYLILNSIIEKFSKEKLREIGFKAHDYVQTKHNPNVVSRRYYEILKKKDDSEIYF